MPSEHPLDISGDTGSYQLERGSGSNAAQRTTGCPWYLGKAGCVHITNALPLLLRTSLAHVHAPQSPPLAAVSSVWRSLGDFGVTVVERVREFKEHRFGKGSFALDERDLLRAIGQLAVGVRLEGVQHDLLKDRVARASV